MTDITYTYTVISVDESARCMEIVYSSEEHGVMHVGARLPFEGETVEQIVAMFAPVQEWRLRALAVIVPELGITGHMTDTLPVVQESIEAQPSALWSEADEAAFNEQVAAEATGA